MVPIRNIKVPIKYIKIPIKNIKVPIKDIEVHINNIELLCALIHYVTRFQHLLESQPKLKIYPKCLL